MIWCELVQALDKTNVLYLRAYKGDGPKAWEVLQAKYKSYERQRLQQLIEKHITSEHITEYICCAEACQNEVKQNGDVTEKTLVAMVLKGLPREYETFVTLVKFSCESKSLDEIKKDLINFESDRKLKINGDVSNSVLFLGKSTRIKCYNCNKEGHKAIDFRKQDNGFCSNCHKKGFITKDCRVKRYGNQENSNQGISRFCSWCKRNGHTVQNCFQKNKTSRSEMICGNCRRKGYGAEDWFARKAAGKVNLF